MNNAQPVDVVKAFKSFREHQKAKLEDTMALTPRLEEIFLRVSAAIGNDPINGEPIARVSRSIADYQRRWGVTLSPPYSPPTTLFVDTNGVLKLRDDAGEKEIEQVIPSAQDLVLLAKTDRPNQYENIVLQDYLYRYVARHLLRAMHDGIVAQ